MLALRPVTTASQNWRLLIVSSSRPIPPPRSPTFSLSGFGPSVSLSWPLSCRPLVFTCHFYSSRRFPSRFRLSLARSSRLHTSLPPEPSKTGFTYTETLSFRDAQTGPLASHATMSSESEDDVPLSRGRGKCPRCRTRRRRCAALGEEVRLACHACLMPLDACSEAFQIVFLSRNLGLTDHRP